MTTRNKRHEEEQNLLLHQRLSELLPTNVDEELGTYLQFADTSEIANSIFKNQFKSENIIDGWKHIKNKFWYHPLHQLAPYLGRFPPALARYFISKFSKEGQVVYDPFCGSGTVPLEANILNREAIGNDIFIYAYTLSHAKVRPLEQEKFDSFIRFLNKEAKLRMQQTHVDEEPLLPDLQVYYHQDTLKQILMVRSILKEIELDGQQTDAVLFTKAIICGILHGDTSMSLSVQTKDTWSASVRYVREYVAKHNLKYEPRDLFACVEKKAQRIYALPLPNRKGRILRMKIDSPDHRKQMEPENESVDLIVTSPPYLSVRDYTLDNWIRVWFLGSTRQKEKENVLRTQVEATYEAAMKNALQQMWRVLKWDRACVIVAGDVRKGKKGNIYHTTQNLARLAMEVGFKVIAIFDDDGINLNTRTSQLFNSISHPDMIDSVPHDSVLILSKGNCPVYDDTMVSYSLKENQLRENQLQLFEER